MACIYKLVELHALPNKDLVLADLNVLFVIGLGLIELKGVGPWWRFYQVRF